MEQASGGPPPIRVLIADDHPLALRGLEALVQREPDMEIVATAADGDEAVRLALQTRPDVAVLDVRMPVKSGLAALQEIAQALPAARCLVLTGSAEQELLSEAMGRGAAGYLGKEAAGAEVLRAIRAVHQGGVALDPRATLRLVTSYQARLDPQRAPAGLSPAELQVLRLLARGLSNRELAGELGLSVRTVTTHLRHIFDKLGVDSRVQAALYAREHGLTG